MNQHDKSDSAPIAWQPEVSTCEYVEQWVTVKVDYELTADPGEVDALESLAADCSGPRSRIA